MSALDRFGGPRSWDLHCQWQEEEYAALTYGATCLDCGRCIRCDLDGHEDIGYCRMSGEWVTSEDTPRSMECEVFES